MSARSLVVRIDDRPAALERLLGRLRTRLRRTPRISLSQEDRGVLQVVVPLPDHVGDRDQLRAELTGLRDVRSVSDRAPGASPGERELALVRIRGRPDDPGPGNGRVLARSRDTIVVEVTGTERELDGLLSSWEEAGVLVGLARTGTVVAPEEPGDASPDG